jgi:pimeloyl-ACP methyl ester carboxylesterase
MPWRETAADLDRARAEQCHIVPAPDGDLYGIFTPPAPEAPPADHCVIIIARPRYEYHRLAVEIARRLASRGFSCFRFDYHGWGDSFGETVPLEIDRPYTRDIDAVTRYVRKTLGQQRLIVWGRCFDALTAIAAFHTAADVIDGLVFIASPVTRGMASDKIFNWRNAVRTGLSPERWRSMLFSGLFRRRAYRALKRVVRGSLGIKAADQASSLMPVFEENFQRMVSAKARALFIYGQEDGELESFEIAERHVINTLPPPARERIEIAKVPGRVHWITDVNAHLELVNRSIEWISTLHPNHIQMHAFARRVTDQATPDEVMVTRLAADSKS